MSRERVVPDPSCVLTRTWGRDEKVKQVWLRIRMESQGRKRRWRDECEIRKGRKERELIMMEG